MKRLSARIQRYMKTAKGSLYTVEEYAGLKRLLWTGLVQDSPDVSVETFDALCEYLKDGHVTDSLDSAHVDSPDAYDDTRYYKITFLEHLLVGDRNDHRLFFFLTQVPLDQVPRYINDPVLALFARWRLMISK
jgi:hypothetical protein